MDSRVLAWEGLVVVEVAALRLVYPAAVVLIERAWAGSALLLTLLSLGLSMLRGWTTDRASRLVRARLFDAIGEAIERYPAVAPPGSPPIDQLESELAKGMPWVEALIGVTLPSILGSLLVLPVIAVLSRERIGTFATLMGSIAMLVGVVAGGLLARRLGQLGERAWSAYQPVARLIESGFRGRVELAVHQRAETHRERLLSAVAIWSKLERRAFVFGGLSAWVAPVTTAIAAALLAFAAGVDPFVLLEQMLRHSNRQLVSLGLLALASVPTLSALSRGLSEWAIERPHLEAIARFLRLAEQPRARRVSAVPQLGSLGRIRFEHVRFAYPARTPEETGATISIDLSWAPDETLAVTGANGSGKTTLTWLLLGAIAPRAGTIAVEIDGAVSSTEALTGRVAYLPQQPYFSELETVGEAVRFAAPDASDQAIEDLLSELLAGHFKGSVSTLLERRALSLSVGERRAVAFARVLLRNAELVILDEPEANLDGQIRARVLNALVRAKSRCRMLIVTHDEAFANAADRIYPM